MLIEKKNDLQGESLEPSTQKNAVPRKHGMQSLGKVPSARRPPANLPSLKAETSTPTDPSWGPETTQSQGTTSTVTATVPVVTTNSGSNSVSVSNTLAVSSPNSVTSLNSNSISSTLVSSSNQSNTSSASSSTTWSSVAGAPVEIAQPPLYQSPQFQHEFPSLDGSVPVPSKGNRSERTDPLSASDGQHMSLRPQTDAASWMQQQQQGGVGNRGENGNSQVATVKHTKLFFFVHFKFPSV